VCTSVVLLIFTLYILQINTLVLFLTIVSLVRAKKLGGAEPHVKNIQLVKYVIFRLELKQSFVLLLTRTLRIDATPLNSHHAQIVSTQSETLRETTPLCTFF